MEEEQEIMENSERYEGGIQDRIDTTNNQCGTYTIPIQVTKLEQKMKKREDEIGGIKQTHVSEGLESDKENPLESSMCVLALFPVDPKLEIWQLVQKKKGKKGSTSDAYITCSS